MQSATRAHSNGVQGAAAVAAAVNACRGLMCGDLIAPFQYAATMSGVFVEQWFEKIC